MYLLSILLVGGLLATSNATKDVTISKCCPFTHTLTSEVKCVETPNHEWQLKVYSSFKRTFLPMHEVPSTWSFKENLKLPCFNPHFYTYSLGNYIPFQNGSLYVAEYNELVPPDRFCIDYRAVLVCLKEQAVP